MNSRPYEPKPIDTSMVKLPEEIRALGELLARNAHDLWATERMAHGWCWGPNRDDLQKQHPCLIPYEILPESEKEYDRKAALGTLAAVLALGYRIEKP